MWFQSNSAGECLFIYVSRNFFLFFVILFGGICVIWLNRFYFFLSILFFFFSAPSCFEWAEKQMISARTIHFDFPWFDIFNSTETRVPWCFAYILKMDAFDYTHTHTSCIILLWWRKRSHYTKVRFSNEHSLDALQTQTIFIYYNKFLRVWST